MRLLRLEKSAHTTYWHQLYAGQEGLAQEGFDQQLAAYCAGGMQYAGAMRRELAPLGYDVMEAFTDVKPLQRAWAGEHGVRCNPGTWVADVAMAQVEWFRPDVLYIQDLRTLGHRWLAEAKQRCPGIRVTGGFICSPSYDVDTLRALDFILTCTEEYFELFRAAGANVHLAHHVFEDDILRRLRPYGGRTRDIVFSGSLWRHQLGHHEREAVLEKMVSFPGFELYCPQAELTTAADLAEWVLRSAAYTLQRGLELARVARTTRRSLPIIGRAATWPGWPMRQLNSHLKRHMLRPVFGIEMFELLRSARVCLNVVDHKEAANIRLYEATGVGTCLLTSYRPNMARLFVPDTEVVLFRSPDECWEKARWLIDHPEDAEQIARRGQERTLREYTYRTRAALVDRVIRDLLR